MTDKITIALPKGRISKELVPIFKQAGIMPEDSFFDPNSRLLKFSTSNNHIDLIRVRSFDVVTFVMYGAAAIGVAGSDVIEEFDSTEIYSPLNLNIGKCRMSVAVAKELENKNNLAPWTKVRVATKYPKTTKEYFEAQGVQAECVKLNGAMELAPKLNLSECIVDLVSTGSTLKSNGLVEMVKIKDVVSKLIVNRAMSKTHKNQVDDIVCKIKEVING